MTTNPKETLLRLSRMAGESATECSQRGDMEGSFYARGLCDAYATAASIVAIAGTYATPESTAPLGKTVFGITVWAVPGAPGRHLAWRGPGDHIHLYTGGTVSQVNGGPAVLGTDKGPVTEAPCQDLAAAQQAVATWRAEQAEVSAEIHQQWVEEMNDR